MINIIDTNKLKKKFGLLLSKLHTDNKLSINEINDIIISRDYFDFLERQEANIFLEESFEMIAKREFNSNTIYEEDILSELYWAGTMYITICLNTRIPLKTIMLLCPLNKMIEYYKIYHEMNDLELINKFMEFDYQISILKTLRKIRKITVKNLSLACDIPEYTIKYYEKDNNHLFNASFENIYKISRFLNFPITYFSKYSIYIPYTYLLFEDKDTFKDLTNNIDKFYNTKGKYEFDGNLLIRKTSKNKEYVPEIYLSSSIDQMLITYSKKKKLIY